MCKKIHLMTSGAAVTRLLSNIAEEQEVMAMLADMVIMIYAMESGFLRAKKMLDAKGEQKAEYHIAAVKIYINDAIPEIATKAKQVFAFVEAGEILYSKYEIIDRLASYRPINTIPLRRIIAEKIIKTQRYPY